MRQARSSTRHSKPHRETDGGHSDVKGLIVFYETELGRKAIEKMPLLTQEGSALGQQWAVENMPRILEELKARLTVEGLLPSPRQ